MKPIRVDFGREYLIVHAFRNLVMSQGSVHRATRVQVLTLLSSTGQIKLTSTCMLVASQEDTVAQGEEL